MKLDDASASQYGSLAALKAHHGVHYAEALRLNGVNVRDFGPYEERWIARLVAAAVADDRETLRAFGDAFAMERERLRLASPALRLEQPGAQCDPDTTQAPFLRAQPVLPFRLDLPSQVTVSRGHVAAPVSEAAAVGGDELDGTMMIKSPLAELRLPGFGAALTPTLVPDMSLDAYALLQAELRVGKSPSDALRRAGVASEGALDGLRQHFFALFQRDPEVQALFQERFRVYLNRLSGGSR